MLKSDSSMIIPEGKMYVNVSLAFKIGTLLLFPSSFNPSSRPRVTFLKTWFTQVTPLLVVFPLFPQNEVQTLKSGSLAVHQLFSTSRSAVYFLQTSIFALPFAFSPSHPLSSPPLGCLFWIYLETQFLKSLLESTLFSLGPLGRNPQTLLGCEWQSFIVFLVDLLH